MTPFPYPIADKNIIIGVIGVTWCILRNVDGVYNTGDLAKIYVFSEI